MKKTKWVFAWLLTFTLILSTSVGYAEPEESAETENENASLLNEFQLPADTPVEDIPDIDDTADKVVETEFGPLTIHKPENVPLGIREAQQRGESNIAASPNPNEPGTGLLDQQQNFSDQLTVNVSLDEYINANQYYMIPVTAHPSILYVEAFVDNQALFVVQSGDSWTVHMQLSELGTHTFKVEGRTTENKQDPNVQYAEKEISFEVIRSFYFDESSGIYKLDITATYEEATLVVPEKKTYQFRINSLIDSSYNRSEIVFLLFNSDNSLIGQSFFDSITMSSADYRITPVLKMALEPGQYRFVAKSKSAVAYSIIREITENYLPEVGKPAFFRQYEDTGYDCMAGDTPLSFQMAWAANAYDLALYVNDSILYYTLSPRELWFSFTPTKVGVYHLKLEACNSADMSIQGAVKVSCEVTIRVTTNDTLETVRSRLQTTLTDTTTYLTGFITGKDFGYLEGTYLLSAKNELEQALQDSQALLGEQSSTKQDMFNLEVDIQSMKNNLPGTKLEIGSACMESDTHYIKCGGRTSTKKPVYLKVYSTEFQLLNTFETVTDNAGLFDLKGTDIYPDNYYAVLSVKDSAKAKVYKKGTLSPSVNTTFDIQNVVTVIISAKNVTNFANCTFEVYYTPAELAPITFVKNALTPVLAVGTYGDIEITEAGDGVVKFKVLNTDIPSGKYFTGVVNMLQFESLQEGTGTVFAKIVTQ